MPEDAKAREARHGQKMIEVRVRFWTNDIADGGRILPKHAWGSGVVLMDSNRAHEITPREPLPFNSMGDLPGVIERVLIAHGVKIHPSSKMRRYMLT